MTATAARRTNPATDLRLARLHLRMGQLGLARAELEMLAGSGDLNDEGLLALAEARWRTGDLTGAGEAAAAYLAGGGDETVGIVIAAEAIAAAGRPTEARGLANRALTRSDVPLDRIFAGMPRSTIWPADSADASLSNATLFGSEAQSRRRARATVLAPVETPVFPERAPEGPGFWDGEGGHFAEPPEPAAILDSARLELDAGRLDEAAVRFAVVLRSAPELAPAVLDATASTRQRSAEIEIVRGDAFRIVGHEIDAARAWAIAAAGLPVRRQDLDAPPDPQAPAGQPPRAQEKT